MGGRRWPRAVVVIVVLAALVFVIVRFGLLHWLPQDSGAVRNVMEGFSWLAAAVTVVVPGTLWVVRWVRGRLSGASDPTPANPLVGRALHLVGDDLPQVSAVGLLQLRVKPAIDTHTEDGTDLPPYVSRNLDDDLEWAIHQGGMVLLHGPAAVGKSRAAAEALRRLRPTHRLLVPRDGNALREIVDTDVELGEVVVWLDDLERFLGTSGLDVSLLQRICPPGRAEVAVVATMRDEELARHTHAATMATTEQAAGIDQAAVELLAQLHGRRRIRVAANLTATELDDARQVGARDPRVLRAITAKEGFAEYLAAGTAMMDRWSIGDGPTFVRGQALISAAVDCRRAGHHKPIPATLLGQLHLDFLPPAWRHRADLPPIDSGLHWAAQRVLGASSPLHPHPDQHYLASDYLLDRTQHGTTPLTGPTRDSTWTTLIHALSADDNRDVAAAAYHDGRLDIAELALAPSAAKKHPTALYNLGVVLAGQEGREGEAEQAYRQAADTGDTDALNHLDLLHAKQEEADQELGGGSRTYPRLGSD